MRVLFCANPIQATEVDPDYVGEAEAARAAGLDVGLVDFEALVAGDATRAVRRVPAGEDLALFRGWMLRPDQYQALHEALAARGVTLLTTPAMYRHAHHFPETYAAIAAHTPRSAWLPVDDAFSLADVARLLAPFGDGPLVLKDYVKSRKHDWHTACFIPQASDRPAVERVVQRFLDLQGPDLNDGLVFREFAPLQALAVHPKSGMPLALEYRAFVVHGRPLTLDPYWEVGAYDGPPPDLAPFAGAMAAIQSPFYSLDVARHQDGRWLIVEVGDGQVAGLPERTDVPAFYRALAAAIAAAPPPASR